jgi:hypothetical protein
MTMAKQRNQLFGKHVVDIGPKSTPLDGPTAEDLELMAERARAARGKVAPTSGTPADGPSIEQLETMAANARRALEKVKGTHREADQLAALQAVEAQLAKKRGT